MRLPTVLVPGLALALLAVAGLADRALLGQARAERAAALLRIDDDARLAARSVHTLVLRLEQAVLANRPPERGRLERLAAPPGRSVGSHGCPSYASRSRAELAELLSSDRATPNGLPEAVVARLALGPTPVITGPTGPLTVEERLLTGALPVRPDDLPLLASQLGLPGDPRVAALAARLRSVLDPTSLPAPPDFRRAMVSPTRLEGWTRTPNGSLVRYEVPVASLIDRAGNAGGPVVSVGGAGLQAASAGAADGSRSIEVAGVPGLVLYVTPRPANPLRTSGLRALLWLSGLAGVAGLAAFGRGLAREARAIDRERAFLAGVTHELRTPLTSIRVLGETLANGRGEPREYGALVAQESQRLAALIERVLTLTRLEEVVRFGRVHPAELLCRTLSIPGLPAHERGTHLDWQAPDGLPECQWDAEAVSRAILNLVDNAIRHGRHGGRVAVSARQEGDAILLAVSDDGTGVGRADRRRVFGRFERGHTSAGGTGLGLYLVEAVARAHGGRVDLVSAEGHGSTFTLVLPVYPPGSLAAAASPS